MNKKKPVILVICDYYLPGYKSGGGMRTIVNTVDGLKEKFNFKIITRDHDGKGDKSSYTSVNINQWNIFPDSEIFYLPKKHLKIVAILKLIKQVRPSKIYANSFFSPLAISVMILLRLRLIKNVRFIIAPCGELSENALKIKSMKKKLFVLLNRFFKLDRNVIWKASTTEEAREIELIKNSTGVVLVAPDLIPKTFLANYNSTSKPYKHSGEAKLIFLSRFVKIKNFKWLLQFLHKVEGNLIIDIYGPLEDQKYWQESLEIIKTLPANIKIVSRGFLKHEDVKKTLLNYHFFILPTLSENFGHIILEALAAGNPVIISDKTPWRNLQEKQIGWDLSLAESDVWKDLLNYCVKMDEQEYRFLSGNARSFAEQLVENPQTIELTEKILSYR